MQNFTEPPEKNGQVFLVCSKCGFSENARESLIAGEKINPPEDRGEGVSDGKNMLATYEHRCEKCGYDKAEVLDMGIFYSDEDNLILLKCGKCGWSERIGRKIS